MHMERKWEGQVQTRQRLKENAGIRGCREHGGAKSLNRVLGIVNNSAKVGELRKGALCALG